MHGCKGTAKDTPSRVSSPTLPGLADGPLRGRMGV
jgi:hypothetical protein